MSRRTSRRAPVVDYAPSRPKRATTGAASAGVKKEGGVDAMGGDEVAELWAQFAADHYEIVEQLPLELHRNSRLLRELDAESLSQQTRLQNKIREYVAYRMAAARPREAVSDSEEERGPLHGSVTPAVAPSAEVPEPPDVKPSVPPESKAPTPSTAPMEARASMPRATPLDVPSTDTRAASAAAAHSPLSTDADVGTPRAVEASATAPVEELDEHAAEAAVELALGAVEAQVPRTPASRATKAHSASAAPVAPFPKPVNLGEISSLISELVRNREEKVAIAVGAYNTIDRHIRALDSALSAHETTVLGFAPSAEPQPEAAAEQATSPKKGRKGRKLKDDTAASESLPPGPGLPPGIEADPNEPRYCYCNQVSYGEMVGCDNDDCPMEWFHLSCLGLTAPPVGDFLCDTCKAQKESNAGTGGSSRKKQRKR